MIKHTTYGNKYMQLEYDDYYDFSQECPKCLQYEQTIDEAGEFVLAIVKVLYAQTPLDVENLEFHLDELCHLLKISIKTNPIMNQKIQIERSENPIQKWINYNNQTLLKIAQ